MSEIEQNFICLAKIQFHSNTWQFESYFLLMFAFAKNKLAVYKVYHIHEFTNIILIVFIFY